MFLCVRCSSAAAMVILISLLSLDARQRQEETGRAEREYAIRIQVNMVSLPVIVTASDGSYTTGLTMEDFEVFEDGVRQEIAGFSPVEEPISVALLLDSSGSTEAQLSRIKNEAIRFIEQLREDDAVAILSFADHVILLEQFSLFAKKNPGVIREIKPGGQSAVYEAIWLAVEQVLKLQYGRKALVVLTDGVDNRSTTVTREETLELARTTDAMIHSIYFRTSRDRDRRIPGGIGRFHHIAAPGFPANQWPPIGIPQRREPAEYAAGRDYLRALSRSSGGLFIDASGNEHPGSAFERIIGELRNQYSLGYYPQNLKHDGSFRTISVRVKHPGLTARAREGWYDN